MSITSEISRLQTAKADIKAAIENKGVTVPSAATLDDYADYVSAISGGGGGTDYLQERLENTLTSYSNSNLEQIGSYGFCGCSNLRTLTLPALKSIGDFGLRNSGIENMNFPSLLRTGTQSTRDLPNLTSVNLPSLTALGSQGFSNCPYLTSVYMPSLSGIVVAPFESCIRLPAVDFASGVNYLAGNVVNGCTALETIILRRTLVVVLQNANNAFNNTRFASGGSGGTIYIPKVLYDHLGDGTSSDYKSATNWSTIDGYGTITWAAIEGSQYETAYADGTPIT